MKRTHLLLLVLLYCIISFAQYNDPYRIAYDGSSYFVTNRGNGTVTEIDANNTKTTVISGLHAPTDIFYASLAGNQVLLILDSNTIKIYDTATLGLALQIPITNAVDAHDGIFNPANSNEFFISDRGGNKIIKGTVGSAPFYPVTFSTFVSNIPNPTGMCINQQGKLIVVSDTTNAKVYEINPSTGALSTVLTTQLDYFNDVTQDNEGNYYITCWGNNNLYRYTSTWTTPYVVATYNNPSGLYANLADDIMVIACTNCQKVEFSFFHLFSPKNDVTVCVNDSFIVDFVLSYKGIGTYNGSNQFRIEMSDSFGHFTHRTIIGSISSRTVPSSLKASVPKGNYADSVYRYRISSTSPAYHSYFSKELIMKPLPKARFIEGDSFYICTNSVLRLTTEYTPNTDFSFFPPVGIQKQDSVSYTFQSSINTSHHFAIQEVNKTTGCTNVNYFVINVFSELKLDDLADTLTMCDGDTMTLTPDKKPYMYTWSGSPFIDNPNNPNVKFFGNSSTKLILNISDSAQACNGTDSVFMIVNPAISFSLPDTAACEGDSIQLGMNNSSYQFEWNPASQFSDATSSNPKFSGNASQQITVTVSDSLNQCKATESAFINIKKKPQREFTLQELEFCFGDTIFKDFSDDSLDFTYINHDQTPLANGGWLADSAGRFGYTLVFTNPATGCYNTFGNGYSIYNKPDSIRISSKETYIEATIFGYVPNSIAWHVNKQWVAIGDTIHTDRLQDGDTISVIARDIGPCRVSSNVIIWEVLSVHETHINFKVYPNPNNGSFRVKSTTPILAIQITDLSGKVVYQGEDATVKTDLAAGMYVLQVKTTEGVGTKKLVIDR